MFERDFDEFVQLLDGTISLNPKWTPLQPMGKALFFKAMQPYTFEQVSNALTAHIRDPKAGMFQPTPAHLIAHIQGAAGNDWRPSADEAWAIALTSIDEAETVVWTEEAAEAFGICRPVLNMGDEVGARRAFIEAYNRLASAARSAGKPAKWNASMGWDSNKREAALTKAQKAGLLPAPTVKALLPNPVQPNEPTCPEGLKKVKEALAQLQDGWAKADKARADKVEAERKAAEQRKAEIADAVRTYTQPAKLRA